MPGTQRGSFAHPQAPGFDQRRHVDVLDGLPAFIGRFLDVVLARDRPRTGKPA
jgi:hypothetical protein